VFWLCNFVVDVVDVVCKVVESDLELFVGVVWFEFRIVDVDECCYMFFGYVW